MEHVNFAEAAMPGVGANKVIQSFNFSIVTIQGIIV